MLCSCVSTLPPEPNHAIPLCENEGHAFANTKMTIPATSASTATPRAASATSAPSTDCARRRNPYFRGSQCVSMILSAAGAVVIQLMNVLAAPAGAPLVTSQKLRTPRYEPALALRSVHGTPL